MGRLKYQKRIHSPAGSKIERKTSVCKASSSAKKKESRKTLPTSVRHAQRRLAITPDDLDLEEILMRELFKYKQNTSVNKGHDGLHLARQNKRAQKRMLAKKKLAGAFGNMGSLVDALPTVKEDNKEISEHVKEKPRLSKSLKYQEMEMMKDIQWYRAAIQDSSFQVDPFAAVAANVHLRLRNEKKKSP